MAKTKLIISGPDGSSEAVLDPKGVVLGRGSKCDVRLEQEGVSRLHARLFRDPFGRWIVEDLGSHNGVFVKDERIKVHAILPGENVVIHPFTLSLEEELGEQIVPESTRRGAGLAVDKGAEEEVLSYKAGEEGILSTPLIRYLNEITARLLELAGPSELYPEACKYLAELLDGLVAFVRLPACSEALPSSFDVLAGRFGSDATDSVTGRASNIYFSKGVLNAVRSTGAPVMARSRPAAEQALALTILDEVRPHVVYSVRVSEGDSAGAVDALYIDILEERAPKEAFEFVEAVARQINFARRSLLLSQARAERRMLDEQLSLAHDIQSRLAPGEFEGGLGVDVAVCYEPAMWVGGDYYDVWSIEDGRIAFAVGDVSGKGLPAAMIMSNLQAALKTTMTFCAELSVVAEHVNRHLCQNLRDDMFVTLFLGLFDPCENKLAYVNCGHIPPLLVRPSRAVERLEDGANLPLGILEGTFDMAEEVIESGSGLVVVTDGIIEAGAPDGAMYEMERLVKLLDDARAGSAQALVRSITRSVADFRQPLAQQDDITVFALVNRAVA